VGGDDGDRGLIGMAVDPNFATNGYVYFSYTYENTPGANLAGPKTARIVRVKVIGDTADESTKTVLVGKVGGTLSTPSCENYAVTEDCIPSDTSSHSAGGLRFGPDGKLYASFGDGAHFDYVDVRALRAQNIDSLGGKIIRINTDGTAPSDNPFYNGSSTSNRSKVFTYGSRNSFRFNFHPTTGVLYSGDVGWSSWEEINKVVRGGNYGWPCYEGVGATTYGCAASPRVDPLYTYPHDSNGAGSITGGSFATNYPASFNNTIFFGDYAQNFIKMANISASGTLISVSPFMTGADGADGPVEFVRGTDGNVYFLSIYTGSLRRILYTTGNRQPIAQVTATPTSGLLPLTVNFSGAGSSDPDGNPLTYLWNFGDGSTSTVVSPSHVYTVAGTYNASLTISDGQGGQSVKTVTITAGNQHPNAQIVLPANGGLYRINDVINVSASGTDPEDGVLPDSAFQWTIILHHNIHTHTLQTATGKNTTFIAPDHEGASDVYTEVRLVVTDSNGLTDTRSVNIYLNNNPVTTGNLILNPSLEDTVSGSPNAPDRWAIAGYGVNDSTYTYPVP
jgi:glucose/arabinose dehydrogenase